MIRRMFVLFAATALIVACGDSSSPTGPSDSDPTSDPLVLEIVSGNSQTGRVGEVLAQPPTVRVRRQSGTAQSGVQVTFSVTSGGGAIQTATATTNSSGLATPGDWTLGPEPGQNTLNATAQGVSGNAVFQATARLPYWTVLVYMAADNNLSSSGLMDIEEMEWAGGHPDVQVGVLAEFSPVYQILGYGCGLDCMNLPSWETFLYVIDDSYPNRSGFDAPVAGQGNLDMTDPATLSAFVNWGEENLRAENYLLVLWNHGGGYTGLIQDESSSSGPMSLAQLGQALQASPSVDVLDFDMCLMGGYETLLSIDGRTDYAVFSEATEPGEGDPYDIILTEMHEWPSAPPNKVAAMIAEAYNLYYENDGARASTTKSAFSLSGLANLNSKISNLAGLLSTQIAAVRAPLASALSRSTKFDIEALTDIGDFTDQISQENVSAEIKAAVSEVRSTAIAGDFRLASFSRNGSDPEAADYSKVTGLHFVFPSGEGGDNFTSSGTRSFSNYQASYPNSGWTSFLGEWVKDLNSLPTVDVGDPILMFNVWDTASANRKADVDYYIVDPRGRVFTPWQGVVTPNGTLSGDSWEEDPPLWYEGFTSGRVVEGGTYRIYAFKWTDDQDRPTYLDLAYRYMSSNEWEYLFSGQGMDPIQLDFSQSIQNDPTPTWEEIDDGAYTDFIPVATWTPMAASNSPAQVVRQGAQLSAPPAGATEKSLMRILGTGRAGRSSSAKGAGNGGGSVSTGLRPPGSGR